MGTELRGISKAEGKMIDQELEKLGKANLVAIIKDLLAINYRQEKLISKLKSEAQGK